MSSYLSQPYQAGQTPKYTDISIIDNTLSTLQNRYTQNKAIIDQTLAKFEMMKLARPQDDEYAAAKLMEAQSAIDAYSKSNGDLSRNTTRDTMLSAFKSIYQDPIILNSLEQKSKLDKLNAEVAKRKEKGDGSYSDMNYQYSLYKGGVQDYMEGKTKKLGDLSYSPYVDYKKTSMEKALKLKELKGDQEIEVPDTNNPGYMIKTKVSGLTAEEVVNYFPDLLDGNERQQMIIDGWSQLSGAKPDVIKQQADAFFTTVKSNLTKSIESEDAIINSSSSRKEQVEEAKRLKNSYTAQLQDYTDKEANIDKTNPEQVGYLLNKQSFVNMTKNLFTGRKSVTYDIDNKFYKDADLARQDREYELKLAKEEREVLEFGAKMKKEYGLNPDGTKNSETLWQATPQQNQEVPDPEELYTNTKTTFNTSYNNIIGAVQNAYTDGVTTDNHRKIFDDKLAKYNYKMLNGKIVSTIPKEQNENSAAVVAEIAFKESGMNNINYGANKYEKIITENSEKRTLLGSALVKAEKGVTTTFQKNPDKYVDDFSETLFHLEDQQDISLSKEISDLTNGAINDQRGNSAKVNDAKFRRDLKEYLIKNPGKLNSFAELADKADKMQENNIFLTKNMYTQSLKSDSFKEASAILETDGMKAFVNQKMTVNVPTEAEKQSIINVLPQQLNDKDGNPQPLNSATFDSKAPITVIPGTDYVDIVQDKGVKADGATLTQATHRAFKGSAAYNIVMSNVANTTDFKLDAKVVPSGYAVVPSIKPYFVQDDEPVVRDNIVSRYESNVGDKLKKQLATEIGMHPAIFLTQKTTELYLRKALPTTVTDEQITKFVSNINNNFEKYTVKVQPNNKQNWIVKTTSPKSGEMVKYLSMDSELDTDYMYIVKNIPQILIMGELTKELIRDPKKIDNL